MSKSVSLFEDLFVQNPSLIVSDRYLKLLNLSYQVIHSLEGKLQERSTPSGILLPDTRWPLCQRLAIKLFMHATTIYYLRQGTKVSEVEVNFFDHASVRIIARSILEIYLVMFEIFFEPEIDDLLEFRFTQWQLSSLIEREKRIQEVASQDSEYQNEVIKLQQRIQEMRNRIRATETFTTLTTNQQEQVTQGKRMPPRGRADILRACGLGAKTFNLMYFAYSSYVHSDELSLTHIIDAGSQKEQTERIEGTMSAVAMIMAKMILNYEQTFPEVKSVCEEKPDFLLAKSWAEAASLLE